MARGLNGLLRHETFAGRQYCTQPALINRPCQWPLQARPDAGIAERFSVLKDDPELKHVFEDLTVRTGADRGDWADAQAR